MQPLVFRIERVATGNGSSLLLEVLDRSLDFLKLFLVCLLSLQGLVLPPESIDLVGVMNIVCVGFPFFPRIELVLQGFHEEIQFMQNHVGQNG